ncbi:hypothetical protein D3C80_1782080 [compost metagenome]
MRQYRAEQRRGLRKHTGRAGADASLAEVEGDVVQADSKESQQKQQWQVFQAR